MPDVAEFRRRLEAVAASNREASEKAATAGNVPRNTVHDLTNAYLHLLAEIGLALLEREASAPGAIDGGSY